MAGPLNRFEWERMLRGVVELAPMTRLVAFALATWANYDGTRAHPGVPALVRATGLSYRSVQRHLATLRSAGLIERTARAGMSGMADCYDLTVPENTHYLTPPSGVTSAVDNSNGDGTSRHLGGVTSGAPAEEPHATRDITSRHWCHNLTPQLWPPTKPRTKPRTKPGSKASDVHGAGVEGSSALAASLRPKPSSDPERSPGASRRYAVALATLQRLPDLGGVWMHRAREDLGDGAPLRDQVIHAAELAGRPP